MKHSDLLLIFLPVAAVNFLIGAIVLAIGVRQLRAAQSLRDHGGASGNAGCAGGLIILVGSGFLLGGLVFLAVALLAAFLT